MSVCNHYAQCVVYYTSESRKRLLTLVHNHQTYGFGWHWIYDDMCHLTRKSRKTRAIYAGVLPERGVQSVRQQSTISVLEIFNRRELLVVGIMILSLKYILLIVKSKRCCIKSVILYPLVYCVWLGLWFGRRKPASRPHIVISSKFTSYTNPGAHPLSHKTCW